MSDNKTQNLGKIYRLVEQFELISRTDLAKLSGLAPASITNLTKILIEKQFIVERTVQDNIARGRPSIGLSVSTFFWQQLCITISPNKIVISLCELNGSPIYSADYTLSLADYPNLDTIILGNLQIFQKKCPLVTKQILAVSICVSGKVSSDKATITQLGLTPLHCSLVEKIRPFFNQPILLNEHFHLWLLAESTVGSLIRDDNAIFLQLDDSINLSVLMRGTMLHQQSKMNVDKMLMPKFSELSDRTFPELDEMTRQQLTNQITFPALVKLIDWLLPNRLTTTMQKIDYFCEQVEQGNEKANQILTHISDNLAYMLMNLINIFSTEKILFNSPLLRIKQPLFENILVKLKKELLVEGLHLQLVTSQFEWHSPQIPCSAIKQGIYEGNLIKNITRA